MPDFNAIVEYLRQRAGVHAAALIDGQLHLEGEKRYQLHLAAERAGRQFGFVIVDGWDAGRRGEASAVYSIKFNVEA